MKKLIDFLIFWKNNAPVMKPDPASRPYFVPQFDIIKEEVKTICIVREFDIREFEMLPTYEFKREMLTEAAFKLEKEGYIKWEIINDGRTVKMNGSLRIAENGK